MTPDAREMLRDILLELIEHEEHELMNEIAELLQRIKRDCRPEFAERVETYLREREMLPPDDHGRH